MNVNQKGAVGLAKVVLDLVGRGFQVFTPFSDDCAVDLVVGDSTMKLKRLQIKYRGFLKDTTMIEVPLSSVVNGKRIPVDKSLIDGWAVYCPNTDQIYYLPVDSISTSSTFSICTKDESTSKAHRGPTLLDPKSFWIVN